MVGILRAAGIPNEVALAEALLVEFRSVGRVLEANAQELVRVVGDPTAHRLIPALRELIAVVLLRRMRAAPVPKCWSSLEDYLHATMAHRTTECARVLHLNAKNMLLRDELMAEGTVDQAAIYPREIARRALELGSSAIILVHNHPSGDPTPSRHDVALTREIVAALKPLGIQVHDHVVIGASGHVSLRAEGMI